MYRKAGIAGEAHHDLAWATGFGKHPQRPRALRRYIEDINSEAESSNCANIFVSSEEFEGVQDLSIITSLKDYFDVRVLVYLRRQDEYLESEYNQHIKMYEQRFSGSIYQFGIKYNFFNRFNYKRLTSLWEKEFGRENILARPYGTPYIPGNVCDDVLKIVSVDGPHSLKRRESNRLNVSLPKEALPYLSRLNRLSLNNKEHARALQLLEDRVQGEANMRFLSPSEANDFYEKFRLSNQYVFKRYMGLDEDPFGEVDTGRKMGQISYSQINEEFLLELINGVLLGDR